MASFTPQLSAPSVNNKWYLHTSKGGYNNSILVASPSVLPNCVGYARGRFSEICGSWQNTPNVDGGSVYGNATKFSRGKTPKLGAIICWSKPGYAGHVAVVEKINRDSSGKVVSITTSESGYKSVSYSSIVSNGKYNSTAFWNGTYYASNNYCFGSYQFQGFVYNPGITTEDKLTDFLKEAEKHIGEKGTWTWTTSGLSVGQPWCAAFVVAVAKKVGGILGTILPTTYGAGELARSGVKFKMGTWHKGPAQNSSFTPKPGDLIMFRWSPKSNYSGKDTYYSDHVGIVKEVTSSKVKTIEGNTGSDSNYSSTVKQKEYSLSYSCINGYFRPDWSKVGASGSTVTGSVKRLYDGQDLNDSQDAAMREICYIDNRSEPSISMSNIKLSMINYTSTLAAIFNIMIRPNMTGYASQDVVLDKVGSVPKQIIQYFIDKGLSAAASVGIAANVQGECSFDIGQTAMDSNGLYSYGMCMWNGPNGTAMTKYVGSNWRTNLTGQCNFLWYDMTSRQPGWFKHMMNVKLGKNMTIIEGLKSVPNTLAGAKTATDIFIRVYENPGDPNGGSIKRQGYAEGLWKKIIV